MRILPIRQLLAIWRATVEASMSDGRWTWGGRNGSNSVSDAEQLLCILKPAADLPMLKLDRPDETVEAALDALQILGDAIEIPRAIVGLLAQYFDRYTDQTGTPVFTADGYLSSTEHGVTPTTGQRALPVVTSYSTSVKLCIAAVGFARVFRASVRREELRAEIEAVEQQASKRLSAALVGLLRSFCILVFDASGSMGTAFCRRLANNDMAPHDVVAPLRRNLSEVMAGIREITIGSGQAADLDHPDSLFECGWSWGVVKDAPRVMTSEAVGTQPDGVAVEAPYLQFTVTAASAIADLFSERTRLLGLLNEEQTRLSQALQLRWELTTTYWTHVATFGAAEWTLEDLPWRTTDGVESDYFSLLITELIGMFPGRRTVPDDDRSRVAAVLVELAGRGRITRRPLASDPALQYHSPGQVNKLYGSETVDGGPLLLWTLSDYTPMLLECATRLLKSVRETNERQRLSRLLDQIWQHLERRRINDGPGRGLWDQPAQVFSSLTERDDRPSWFSTYRVVECLISTAGAIDAAPARSQPLASLAVELLNEAEHLYDREMLGSTTSRLDIHTAKTLENASANLALARELLAEQPGPAAALALDVMKDLTSLIHRYG